MSRLPYEKPSVIKHVTGLANKFGRGAVRKTLPRIDEADVAQLIERFGTPLFVFSERQLRQKYRELHRSFTLRYPKVQFAWSYKTNFLDAVCRVFHQEGAWAEVVSETEYEMARRLGVPGERIVYNGPYKPQASLERAFAEGARVHLDHYDELYLAEQIAKKTGRTVSVGLRVNMDTGIYPQWDRFGFNLDNGEALDAARRIRAGGHLSVEALHAHLGTFILEPDAYRQSAAKLSALALQVRKETGMAVRTLDFGGGFPSRATLHGQYAPGADSSPALDDYAVATTRGLLAAGFEQKDLPLLMLETGRALVDEAGYCITRVVGNKRLPSGARAVIVDAGVNVLFTSYWYRHELIPVNDPGGMAEETVVYGPLCMNIDVIRPSAWLPPLETGDALVVHPVGAYNVTQWMQFIRMRPPVVLAGERGEIDVIREAETIDTVKGLERLPERLKPKA